ncbi:hypothetical protein [Pseudonocardia zijingensis]|uniref:hypothetical protein n=1 Tax=Pseudonocardia zijingensis TaxID=153376 RepID=UPI0031DA06A7
MRAKLPIIYCPDCRTQLVNHLYVDLHTDTLLCLFCARNRPTGTVAPLNASEGEFVTGERAPLNPADAITLLRRLGAAVVE